MKKSASRSRSRAERQLSITKFNDHRRAALIKVLPRQADDELHRGSTQALAGRCPFVLSSWRVSTTAPHRLTSPIAYKTTARIRTATGFALQIQTVWRTRWSQPDTGEMQHSSRSTPNTCPSWLESLFDLSPICCAWPGCDGYFEIGDPASNRTTGIRPRTFVAADHRIRTSQGPRAPARALAVMAEGGELRQFEPIRLRDGSISWLQWNARPRPRSDGLVAAPRGTSPTVCGDGAGGVAAGGYCGRARRHPGGSSPRLSPRR